MTGRLDLEGADIVTRTNTHTHDVFVVSGAVCLPVALPSFPGKVPLGGVSGGFLSSSVVEVLDKEFTVNDKPGLLCSLLERQ